MLQQTCCFVSILEVSSCILAGASSPVPLDSLLQGATGPPTTLSWCRGAQSSPCLCGRVCCLHQEGLPNLQGCSLWQEKYQEHMSNNETQLQLYSITSTKSPSGRASRSHSLPEMEQNVSMTLGGAGSYRIRAAQQ